jgi:hypothetical protein
MICIIRAMTEIITKALAMDYTDDMKSVTLLTGSAGHRAKIFWMIFPPNNSSLAGWKGFFQGWNEEKKKLPTHAARPEAITKGASRSVGTGKRNRYRHRDRNRFRDRTQPE